MLKKLLWPLIFAISIPLGFCKEQKHYIELGLGRGTSGFQSVGLMANWSMEGYWNFILNGYYSSSENDDGSLYESKEYELGFYAKKAKNYRYWASLVQGREAEDITYYSIKLGNSFKLSSLWNGKRSTVLSLDLKNTKYKQSVTTLKNREFSTVFGQNQATIGINQNLGTYFSTSFSYTDYYYDTAPEELEVFLESRPNLFGNSQDIVSSFLETSSSVGLLLMPHGNFDIEFSYTKSLKVLDHVESETSSITPTFYFSRYTATINMSRTKQEDSIDSDYLGLNLGISY